MVETRLSFIGRETLFHFFNSIFKTINGYPKIFPKTDDPTRIRTTNPSFGRFFLYLYLKSKVETRLSFIGRETLFHFFNSIFKTINGYPKIFPKTDDPTRIRTTNPSFGRFFLYLYLKSKVETRLSFIGRVME
ncbi:unnamed protein product [Meloidogyne enterolobii]|uniref:Uncharacterized protein n=1 Tax=Meloidogyne enterolobii TaxID=390850 RepID=A0ACB0ZTN5_MELEN